jgi:enoyl-CoA hydratase/carnithine racemase
MDPGGTHLDPRLLQPVDGLVPAQAVVDDLAGEPALLRIEGAWDGVDERAAAFLGGVPLATLAVGSAPPAVAAACDLATADPAAAADWCAGFARTPYAAHAAALLLRTPPPGTEAALVAESTTYSMLMAGPEYQAWLAARPRRAAAPDRVAPRVRVERDGPVAEVVLTRADRHNAFDTRMRDELCAALAVLALQPDVTVVVRGEGPSFSSGGDLDEFGTAPGPVPSHAVRLARSAARQFAQLAPRLVVGVHGATLGAGIELAAFAGTVVAAADARIGLPELGFGLVPGAGGTVSMPRRCGRQRVLRLLYEGEPIDAVTAHAWGLVDEVVAPAALADRVRLVARRASAAS